MKDYPQWLLANAEFNRNDCSTFLWMMEAEEGRARSENQGECWFCAQMMAFIVRIVMRSKWSCSHSHSFTHTHTVVQTLIHQQHHHYHRHQHPTEYCLPWQVLTHSGARQLTVRNAQIGLPSSSYSSNHIQKDNSFQSHVYFNGEFLAPSVNVLFAVLKILTVERMHRRS